MSFVPYALARPFLFGLDAEAAHHLTMAMLAKTQGTPWALAYRASEVNDPYEMAGLRFPNRVGLAAGLDKNAECIDGLSGMGFGFLEVGTVTPLAQPGNPKPRMFRLPKANALINRLGFNNDGLEAFVANVQKAKCRQPQSVNRPRGAVPALVLGLNIGKNASTPIESATSDYLLGLAGVYPHADYVSINISSPNTQNLRELQTDAALDSLLTALVNEREKLAQQHGRRVPLFLKIAPDLDAAQVTLIASTLTRHADRDAGRGNLGFGVVATNTTTERSAVKGMAHCHEAGGLSGSPVLAASNRVIAQLRRALGKTFPIIGVGGILSAEDAVLKIAAGADVVQIYTGLIYKGPMLVGQAARAIQALR